MSSSDKIFGWAPIIQKLETLITDNNWNDNFNQAIADAKKADVPDLDHINSLEDLLYDFNQFLFWKPTENEKGDVVYNKICLFYWILDQPNLMFLQSQILPTAVGQQLTPLSEWIVEYANALGAFYDMEQSIDKDTIDTFYKSPAYHMDQYERPTGDWKTFNEFFARQVKKGKRDPEDPWNPEVIVSAADSVFDGYWPVDDKNNVFFVKGVPWNIKDLLAGSDYAESFNGGVFMHAFLNTTDYHRQRAPIMGTVLEAKVIQGSAYLEVVPVTSPTSSRSKFAMRRHMAKDKTDANIIRKVYQGHMIEKKYEPAVSAPDNPGYQFLQARGCIVIDSPIGLVAVLPVGMAQVSSVRLSVEKHQKINKGDEISYFQFGGSDIVLVFEKGSDVHFTAVKGDHYNTGKQIARAKVPAIK